MEALYSIGTKPLHELILINFICVCDQQVAALICRWIAPMRCNSIADALEFNFLLTNPSVW